MDAIFSLRIVVGLALVFAGGLKIHSKTNLAAVFGTVWPRLFLPDAAARLAPWIEIALGALWMLPIEVAALNRSTLVLFGIFTTTSLVSALRGRGEACRCFGDFWILSPWKSFVRSFVLFLLAGLAVSRPIGPELNAARGLFSYLTAVSLVLAGALTFHAVRLRAMRIATDSELVGD